MILMAQNDREDKIIKFWEDNHIFEKSVNQRPKTKQYVFYDGPPFATGTPHYGHMLGLTSKDLFPRYWTMKGYRCERRWGWDCHGLPIESIAEKELGIKDKKGIIEMGVDKFNEFCRSKVLFFVNEWGKVVRRLGKWIEFDNSYKTMDNNYMESVWFILKKLYDNGYVYEGKKILMYCPHCETPLAKAEIEMDKGCYKDITEKTAVAKFKLIGEDAYVLAWTTTPWTLIGNVALAVNSKLDYVKIKIGTDNYIIAKGRLSEIKEQYSLLKQFKGSNLVGKKYEPLYKLTNSDNAYVIIDGGDKVLADEGTGIVHLALYGEFDFEMIKKHSIPEIQHVGKDGKLVKGPWAGLWFKKADPEVINDLRSRDLLYKSEDHTHSYPFCYRCDTPLIYNAVDSWFVNIQKIKPELIKKSKQAKMHPSNLTKQFNYIISTAPDWTISRNRFWATSLPIWKCDKCSHVEVIGSVKELQSKAVEEVIDNLDLHKHVVDKIHLKCKCGGVMNRIPEVIDCWFESGSMPYAAKHYPFENKSWFKDNYPADFVSEYTGQIRAWYYYMHVIGVLMFGKPPFKNIVVTGVLLASDGSKMSKSKHNYPDITPTFDKYSADALRFYLMNSVLMRAQDTNFNEKDLDNTFRKVVMLLGNISKFYELFNNGNKKFNSYSSTHILDKWIVSKTNLLIKNITKALDNYDTVTACSELIPFIDELSTWYVRRSRDRFRDGNKRAIMTLAYVLNNLIKLMAPITPFITEEIYQMFRKSVPGLLESVHLEKWPKYKPALINETLNNKMKLTREIVSLALLEREKAKIPIRQALSRLTVKGASLTKPYLDLIKDELNVKRMQLVKAKSLSVKLDTKITDSLLLDGIARELIRQVNNYRKELGLTIKDKAILYYRTADKLVIESFNKFKKEIMSSVQAVELRTDVPSSVKSKEVSAHDSSVKIALIVLGQ